MKLQIKDSAQGYAEPVKGKPGTFRLYFSLGKDPVTGKYRRSPKKTIHCKSGNPKNWHKECINQLREYRKVLEGEADEDKNKEFTVADYAESFHELRKDAFKSPLAFQREGDYIRHISSLFGEIRLSDLHPDDVRRVYAKALENGMSESELHGMHIKLRQILQDAVDNELIDRNPCSSIRLPRPVYQERKPLTAEEASRLLGCLLQEHEDARAIGTVILLECGLRKGEMLGLKWIDYDREKRTLSIARQYSNDHMLRPPKSKTSRRTIAISTRLMVVLDIWKRIQLQQLQEFGLDQTEDTPIVHSLNVRTASSRKHVEATHMDGHNFDRWFRDFCVDNGFGTYQNVKKRFVRNGKVHIRGDHYIGLVPHALRHTQATLLIGEGMDVKTVQARLGHASPNITLGIYSHAIETNDKKAAKMLDSIISS